MKLVISIAAAVLALASAVSLPSVDVRNAEDCKEARWWTRVGDRVFYAPPVSMLELSQDASSYYYAAGSSNALTAEMKQHRVGGQGRWHIFHLPQGPSMLQVPTRGSRHESFSELLQLQHGQVLSDAFPVYQTNESYTYPGSAAALGQEKAAVETVDAALYRDLLTKVTTLGVDNVHTRSNSNPTASATAVQFLQEEFQQMGLSSCLHQLHTYDGERHNVVAFIPGSSSDTFTVGAHYDSRPYEGAAPGANDNGSGLTALLAIAKAFTQANLKPVKNLYFVGFAGEEKGLLGSAAFVGALLQKKGQLPEACRPAGASFLQFPRVLPHLRRGASGQGESAPHHSAIILDEVGWKSTNMVATVNLEARDTTAGSFDLMNQIAQANLLHNSNVTIRATHSNHPFGSDHMSFIQEGLPAALVINGDDEAYPSYHSSSDTIDMVDMDYATALTRMVFGGVVRAAGLQA